MAIKYGRPIEARLAPVEAKNVSKPATRLDLAIRPRRNRKAQWTRRLVAENVLTTDDLIWPLFVTGGENVYSSEVEAAVYSHPCVKEAAVIGIPDARWGELVMACVALKDGAVLTAEDLIEHCRTRLAGYKAPRRIEFIAGELPKSGTNKILKRKLREPYWKGVERRVG
jgi:acyl-CoA synthetase (AMP-forming)/AMP-acid ligase II